MVKIKFIADPKEGSLEFRAKGHARTAAAGKDLLCASVSSLALTLAAYVRKAEEDGLIKEEPRIKIKNGLTIVKCRPKDEGFAQVLHAYYVIQIGMSLLGEYQPDHIGVTVFDDSVEEFSINKTDSPT